MLLRTWSTFWTIVHSTTSNDGKDAMSSDAFGGLIFGCFLGSMAFIVALGHFVEQVRKIPGMRNDLYWLGVMAGIYIGMVGVCLLGFVHGAVDVILGALWGAVVAMASGLLVRVEGGVVAGLKSLL